MNSSIEKREDKVNKFKVYYISSTDLLERGEKINYLDKWNYCGMFGDNNEYFNNLPDHFRNLEDILNTVEKYTNYTLFSISSVNNSNWHKNMLVFKTK